MTSGRSRLRANQCSAGRKKPDAIAEMTLEQDHQRFTNFRYPALNTDLASVLARLAMDRRKR